MKLFFMDMETLGTRENSIILSIGVLAADTDKYYKTKNDLRCCGIKVFPNKYEQEKKYKCIVDLSTIDWWGKQNETIRHQAFSQNNNAESCILCFTKICEFLEKNDFSFTDRDTHIWSRGLFDQKLWDSFTRDLLVDNPIHYGKWRDTRTACDILGGREHEYEKNIDFSDINFHDPLDDCMIDFLRLRELFSHDQCYYK